MTRSPHLPTWVSRVLVGLVALALLAELTGCTRTSRVGSTSAGPTSTPVGPMRPTSVGPTAVGSTGPTSAGSTGSSLSARALPNYVFPVRSTSARFGSTHHDYPATDIFAPCGTQVLAVTNGVVAEVSRKDDWTTRENSGATRGGLSVSIVGMDGVRYYGSHLKSIVAAVVPGHRVRAGEVLGLVGHTGSARPTACHLHFGISPPCAVRDWWNRRGVLSPYAFLTSWRGGGQRSPVQAVAGWRSAHGCPTKPPKGA